MTSSSEARVATVLPSGSAGTVTPLRTPDLREGAWTRFSTGSVRGDASTESVLDGLAERTRAAARSQGYTVGWSEGRQEALVAATLAAQEAAAQREQAESRREAEHRAALQALRTATADLREATAAACAAVEQQATELAVVLTETLVGHALDVETPADVVRRVLQVLPPHAVARVRVHPAVVASTAAADLTDLGTVLVADATLAPHDAMVELDDHLHELDLDAAMARVREVLA